jgi:hypothetical protein
MKINIQNPPNSPNSPTRLNMDNSFKVILHDPINGDKEYDIRNILLLFEKLLKDSELFHLLDIDHEDLKKVLEREESINKIL